MAGLAQNKLNNIGLASDNSLRSLIQIPLTVDDGYHQTLLSISDHSKYLAAALLRWMVFAVRPLQLKELEVGLEMSTGANINQTTLKQIIDLCGSLVMIQEGEVALIHQTTRDFLLLPTSSLRQDPRLRHFHFNQEAAHSEIAQACLTYLARGSLDKGPLQVIVTQRSPISKLDEEHLSQFPFLSYATISWTEHARCSPLGGINFVSPFFQPNSAIRETWWKTYWISTRPASTWRWTAPTPFSLLHLAAYFGILSLAVTLENQGLLQDQLAERDNHSNRAIMYAVENRHFDLSSFLLSRGASKIRANWLNDMDAMEEPLLHCAAKSGDTRLISLLLEHGEPVNEAFDNKWDLETNGGYITTLARYLPKTVKEMTEKWHMSEKNKSQLNYGQDETALHIAASRGHDLAVATLLEAGANIGVQTSGGWTALHNAAWFGRVSTIGVLLAHGANVMAECDHKWTPLHYAAHQDQTETVKLLLENGAQIEAKSSKQKTALHVASSEGHIEVVELLLDHKADIESKTIAEATPLHMAVWAGQDGIVKFLLDHGADKTALNRGRQTPEMVALNRGESKIAKMLQTHVITENPPAQEGKNIIMEKTLSSSSSPAKATSSSPGNITFINLREPIVSQSHSRPAPEVSDFPELYVANTQVEPEANLPWHLSGLSGYDDGLIPISPVDNHITPLVSPPISNSPDKLSASFKGLEMNETSPSTEQPSMQSLSNQSLPIRESPIPANPVVFTRPRSHPISSAGHSAATYPPPPPYSEHHQYASQESQNTHFNPNFQTSTVSASVPISQAIPPPPPSQVTSPVASSPVMHTSPPLSHPQSSVNFPPTYTPVSGTSQSSLYSPSSYPLPPSRASSTASYNTTPKYRNPPPPLPPRSPIDLPVSNRPTIENVSQYHNYQQPTAQAQLTYPSPTTQTNTSYVQILTEPYSYSQSGSLPQTSEPKQNPIFQSQAPSFAQNPTTNHPYLHPQPQLQPNWTNVSIPPPASPYLASPQGPISPISQIPSPYMALAAHAAPPPSYLNPSFGSSPSFAAGQAFAPPPTGLRTPQSTSFGAQALRKSSSFLNLNIMGKKLL